MDEKWLPVVGYEGRYEVSDQGRVRSLPRRDRLGRQWQGKMLNPYPRKTGHLVVTPSGNGANRVQFVHRLVLEAHVGAQPPGMEVCHNDGDPTNNTLFNLRWDTHSGNMLDRSKHGTHYQRDKVSCPTGHPLEEPNISASHRARGYRACLACTRARATLQRLRRKGLNGDFQAIADDHLLKILATK